MAGRDTEGAQRRGRSTEELSLIDRIFSVFFNLTEPDRKKKRALKAIGRNLSKDRYGFYKPRDRCVQPAFGRFLYEICKTISAVRKFVLTTDTSGAFKMVVIDLLMDERQRQLREALDEHHIREAARDADLKVVTAQIKETLIHLVRSFDAGEVKRINTLYSDLRSFAEFCHFDFYFMVKKFDSAITEDSFTYTPRFGSIDCEYVIDDIRDFLDVATALPEDANWDAIFDVLAAYRNAEMVDRAKWRNIWTTLRDVLDAHILEDIVRHGSDDPSWAVRGGGTVSRAVELYIAEVKSDIEQTLQGIYAERRSDRVEQLTKHVFGETAIARTKNYSERANLQFQGIEGGGYIHVQALTYLMAYLLNFFKTDVREIVQDILIVRGKWVTHVQAQQISDAYHGVLTVSEQAIRLDSSLGDEGELGLKIRRAMGRVVERNRGSQKTIRELLDQVNKQVLDLVNEAARNFIIIGKILKFLIEDVDRREPQIITNWKELDGEIEDSLKERMAGSYKQMYYLVQLLQVLAGKQ